MVSPQPGRDEGSFSCAARLPFMFRSDNSQKEKRRGRGTFFSYSKCDVDDEKEKPKINGGNSPSSSPPFFSFAIWGAFGGFSSPSSALSPKLGGETLPPSGEREGMSLFLVNVWETEKEGNFSRSLWEKGMGWVGREMLKRESLMTSFLLLLRNPSSPYTHIYLARMIHFPTRRRRWGK